MDDPLHFPDICWQDGFFRAWPTGAGRNSARNSNATNPRHFPAAASHARWYHAITTNRTPVIRSQHAATERAPFDWRMLVNGFMDGMLCENGGFVTDGLPFPELKKRSLTNNVVHADDQSPDFSKLIRAGRPGSGK